MAEAGLSIDINGIRREVGIYLGWGRNLNTAATDGWTSTNYADYEDIQKRALRWFYWPPGPDDKPFEWSFLRKTGTITLVNTNTTYVLPDDFSTISDGSLTYAAGVNQYPLQKVSETDMRRLQRTSRKGYPKYYTVRNKAHAPTTGQRFEIIFHPTPDTAANAKVITYNYNFLPNILSNTNKYPVGGARHSETILAAHLAAAEAMFDDEPEGPYRMHFTTLLGSSMRADARQHAETRSDE